MERHRNTPATRRAGDRLHWQGDDTVIRTLRESSMVGGVISWIYDEHSERDGRSVYMGRRESLERGMRGMTTCTRPTLPSRLEAQRREREGQKPPRRSLSMRATSALLLAMSLAGS